MFKQQWKKWTLDKPAAFGDFLWQVLVVELAALLYRLTLRQVIAFIPVVILILAYAHRIPIPPELMLVGDVLAYIDVFSVILLLSMFGRVTAAWLYAKRTAEHALKLARRVPVGIHRFDFRRSRDGHLRNPKRSTGRTKFDDEHPAIERLAWA